MLVHKSGWPLSGVLRILGESIAVSALARQVQIVETLRMLRLRDFFKPRSKSVKRWENDPKKRPWFDHPDALSTLERRRKHEGLSDGDFEALRHWVDHGYIVTRDLVPVSDVDGMLKDLDDVWTTSTPIEGLIIDNLRLRSEDPPGLPHSKLVTVDQATKEKVKRESNWRIHEFISYSESARRIFQNAKLARLCSLILGGEARPSYTINFTFGSSQDLHQDTAVFSISPMNHIVGAWLACEDIHPDSGPLVFYPGSHKESLFPGFDNYPQTTLKTCPKEMMGEYYRHLENVARRYERKTFIAKKGEWFLWHGMIIHGGDKIQNRELTRRSYVCHYIPPGMNKELEIHGPFNW
jgi:hypothetical protein